MYEKLQHQDNAKNMQLNEAKSTLSGNIINGIPDQPNERGAPACPPAPPTGPPAPTPPTTKNGPPQPPSLLNGSKVPAPPGPPPIGGLQKSAAPKIQGNISNSALQDALSQAKLKPASNNSNVKSASAALADTSSGGDFM